MGNYIAVFIGGGLGTMARYGISIAVTDNFQGINPTATMLANVVATFILGAVLILGGERLTSTPVLKGLLVTGFCGGFSTFSTFSYETFMLFRYGYPVMATANILLSLLLAGVVLYMLISAMPLQEANS